jgi:hypothetical protein
MATEKTTSLPMLFLSGQQRKEVLYVSSHPRGYPRYVFPSASFAFGHEGLSPDPLFFLAE